MTITAANLLSLKQKYILVGLLSTCAALFYILRNIHFIGIAGAPHLDIATFYAAAEAVFTGKSSPYSLAVLELYKPVNLAAIFPFLYLPSALPFFWPLAGHDFQAVFHFTLYLNATLIFLLITGMALWTLRLTSSLWAALLITPVLTEGSRGLWATLWYGQINALLALMLLGCLWALTCQRRITAGILLGITITLKIYPAILLPWLVLRRDWNTLAAAIGTVFLLAVATWIWLPHYLWSDWFSKVAVYGYGTQLPGLMPTGHWSNLGVHGVLMRSFEGGQPVAMLMYLAIIIFAATGLYTAHRRPHDLTGNFASFMWLTLLLAPVTWLSHLAYMLFVPVWFLALAWNNQQYAWAAIFTAIYTVTLQLTMLDFEPGMWRQNMPATGLLALWGMMQYQLWRNENQRSAN